MGQTSTACAIASLSAILGAGQAGAGLTYDLRFSDNTKQKNVATGFVGSFNLDLWARVSGTDSDHLNDGLIDSYIVLQSTETGDLFDGLLAAGTALSPFNVGRNGAAGNLSNDGVGDWGSTAALIEDSRYMYAKSASQIRGGGVNGQSVDGTTWEFRIASFALNLSAVHPIGNDETVITVTRPVPTFPLITLARYVQDDVMMTVTNQQYAGVYGSHVSLVGSSSAWDGGPGGSGNEWTTPANWAGDSTPNATSIATFGAGGTATVVGINMGAQPGNSTTVAMIRLDTDANRDLTIQNSSAVSGTLSLTGVGGLVLDNQSSGRTLSLSGSGAGALSVIFPSAASINVSNAASMIDLSAPITSNSLVTKTGAGTLIIRGDQQNWTGGLSVAGGKVVIPPSSSGVSYLATLNIAPGASLDLNDNDLVVNVGDFATLQSLAFEGYSTSLDSTKTGITSTTSQGQGGTTILALFDNALAGFSDYPFGSGNSIATGAIVGKYTYIGDTNFDGQVTAQDYTAIDANIGTSVSVGISWFYGDTNFDGNIDATDYTGIDAALGLGQGNPLAVHALPEPAALVPLALGFSLRRNRRRPIK